MPPASAAWPGGAGGGAVKSAAATTISSASTVAKRPAAHKDKALISMVPASVRVRREEAPKPKGDAPSINPGFGLAPVQRATPSLHKRAAVPQAGAGGAAAGAAAQPRPPSMAGAGTGGVDSKLAEFMASLQDEALL